MEEAKDVKGRSSQFVDNARERSDGKSKVRGKIEANSRDSFPASDRRAGHRSSDWEGLAPSKKMKGNLVTAMAAHKSAAHAPQPGY